MVREEYQNGSRGGVAELYGVRREREIFLPAPLASKKS